MVFLQPAEPGPKYRKPYVRTPLAFPNPQLSGMSFDAVFQSPLARARQTADAILQRHPAFQVGCGWEAGVCHPGSLGTENSPACSRGGTASRENAPAAFG